MSSEIDFTRRELEVMRIFWKCGEPMLASEIASQSHCTIYSIQPILKHLLKKNAIKVADIVYSGNVLARKFQPIVSEEDFEIKEISDISGNLANKNISASHLIASLLEQEKDKEYVKRELLKLDALIKEKMKELNDGGEA